MRPRFMTEILTTIIMTLLLCSTASASFMGIFGDRGIKGSGQLETRELNLDEVKAVSLHGAFELNVALGKKQAISVTIDDNLWDNLDIKVKGSTLILDWDKSCRPDSDCRIDLVLRELKEVSIHGAGDVNIDDFRGDVFTFDVHGAGDLEIDGKVDELNINISGAGDVDAKDLQAKHVEVRISGAGNATVFAEKSIKARVSGVGNLNYYGDPEEKDTQVSGIGSIRQK